LTFVVIIGSVVVHSLTAGALARWLGLSSRGEQGVVITSSSKVGLLLGEALLANDIKVLVVDTSRDGLHAARMKGMETFFGNPLSESADRYMDLTGYNWLWAVSPNAEANAMACARYRPEFDPRRVLSLSTAGPEESDERRGLATGLRTNTLFGSDVTWPKLAEFARQGARPKSTPLTEEYDFEDYEADQSETSVKLFALDEKGRLRVFGPDHEMQTGPGWTIVSLATNGENRAISRATQAE
jgi:NhaP-type Na+/H+ or K+/H+ antiporter